jgi:hypothetical protein
MGSPEKDDEEGGQSKEDDPEADEDGKKDLIDKSLLYCPEV